MKDRDAARIAFLERNRSTRPDGDGFIKMLEDMAGIAFEAGFDAGAASVDAERSKDAEALLEIRPHYYCEDGWYSCPKAPDGCYNDSIPDVCNCGAEEYNNRLNDYRAKYPAKPTAADDVCENCGHGEDRHPLGEGWKGYCMPPCDCKNFTPKPQEPTDAVQFNDAIPAMKEAHKEGVKDGRRAVLSELWERVEAVFTPYPLKRASVLAIIDELSGGKE